jgi:hypothetical protein
MKVGDSAQLARRFQASDLAAFTAVSGCPCRGGQVPEPLIGALFSCLLGVHMPGLGTMYLKQETRFDGLAVQGELLTARVEITRVRPEKHLIDLATTCHNEAGDPIAHGRALVYVRDVVSSCTGMH